IVEQRRNPVRVALHPQSPRHVQKGLEVRLRFHQPHLDGRGGLALDLRWNRHDVSPGSAHHSAPHVYEVYTWYTSERGVQGVHLVHLGARCTRCTPGTPEPPPIAQQRGAWYAKPLSSQGFRREWTTGTPSTCRAPTSPCARLWASASRSRCRPGRSKGSTK